MLLDRLFINQDSNTEFVTFDSFRSEDKPYLIVSYGLGRDSTAMLIQMAMLGIRPDLILFSDTGAEKDASYAYLPVINDYLRSVGFPEVTVIKLNRHRDRDFETHLFRLGIFASLSYGSHKCSATWKLDSQDDFLKNFRPVIEAKREGRKIVRAVGFEKGEEYRVRRNNRKKDAKSPHPAQKTCKSSTAFTINPDSEYQTWFPLIELGIDFDTVLDTIWRAELPVPPKSSCYFCAGMREIEIYELSQNEPHKFFRALVLEKVVQRNKIVPHTGRVQGIAFGKKWSDYECADPFADRIDEVIEFFGLDREFADGDKGHSATGWKPKRKRVELFVEFFKTPELLQQFINNKRDLSEFADKILQINQMPDVQMTLPLD